MWRCEFSQGMCKNQLLAEAEGTGQVKAQQNQGQTLKRSDQKEKLSNPQRSSCDLAPAQVFWFL